MKRTLVFVTLMVGAFGGCKQRTVSGVLSAGADDAGAPGFPWLQPWELASTSGDMLLPDVFYAEPVQNDQIMPTTLDLANTDIHSAAPCAANCYEINHLIYPTIGHPSLVAKDDAAAEFSVVLRLEDDLLAAAVHASTDAVAADPYAVKAQASGVRIFLIAQGQRGTLTDGAASLSSAPAPEGVRLLSPSDVRVRGKVGIPELDARTTVQLLFNQAAFAEVPAGLYDVRMEVTAGAADQAQPTAGAAAPAAKEYQFNALRVFDHAPGDQDYWVVNVTDTQMSVSDRLTQGTGAYTGKKVSYGALTHDKLAQWVTYVNAQVASGGVPEIANAAFVTFNGDLHNGGSPASVTPYWVAWTYNYEAQAVINILKDLKLPIFLTAGNHDGYVSTGHAPGMPGWESSDVEPLSDVVQKAAPGDNGWPRLSAYVNATGAQPGGLHNDIFTGKFVQRGKLAPPGAASGTDGYDGQYHTMADAWRRLDAAKENVILFDGFNQWRKSYGPLYYSWSYGRNHYLSINSYDLRQHRRSGWGMYTVNYGGNVSQLQMDWIKRDMEAHPAEDLVLLAHHDPRGGHEGKDYPFQFAQVDYTGMSQSAINYINGEELDPRLCKILPVWARTLKLNGECLHDGLQEWMSADPEFDCDSPGYDAASGKCRTLLPSGPPGAQHPRYSAYQMIHRLTTTQNARTLLLGHTHYNSVEIKQGGEELVPKTVTLDAATLARMASIESSDPVRAETKQRSLGITDAFGSIRGLVQKSMADLYKKDPVVIDLAQQGHDFQNQVQGDRELVILRMTSLADLTTEVYAKPTSAGGVLKRTGMGFTLFHIGHAASDGQSGRQGYPLAQLNQVVYLIADGQGGYDRALSIGLPRATSVVSGDNNPLNGVFYLK